MIYNFNLGIGWASSGVEYAQAYRAKVLRELGLEAKFVFTDMFPRDNIQHMTENIGFLDSEVLWLYTFFSDCKISPVTYTLRQSRPLAAGVLPAPGRGLPPNIPFRRPTAIVWCIW